MVREYNYSKPETNISSGKLFIEPKYGFKFKLIEKDEDGGTIHVEQERIEANPIVPLGDFTGIHIRYENVEELFINDGEIEGSIQHTNHISTAPAILSQDDFFPKVPYKNSPKHGTLRDRYVKNKSGDIVETFSNDEYKIDDLQSNSAVGIKAHIKRVFCGDGLYTVGNEVSYKIIPSIYRVTKTTAVKDGVTSITDYDYSFPNVDIKLPLSPVGISYTNSDGKVHRKEIKYGRISGTLFHPDTDPCLFDANIVEVPILERNYADGVLQGGWRVDYTTSNNGHCKPATYFEILSDGTEYWRTKVLEYDSNGNPSRIQKRGYDAETLTWNDHHLLEQKDWNNWTQKWDYFEGSSLLEKYTDIDEQETDYLYDGLMRLDVISERGGNIQTNLSYAYQVNNNALNSVLTEVQYTGAEKVSTTQYMDGLGRDVQTVKCGYSFDNKDIYTTYTYDGLGRVVKESQPVEGNNSCEYYPSNRAANWETCYEESPLNRPIFNKLSSWPAGTGTFYGCNRRMDQVKIYEVGCGTSNSGVYGECSLYKTTNIDENGQITEVYTDKLGRQVLVRKFLGIGYDAPYTKSAEEPSSSGAAEPVDTYTVYDDIGNIALVISPESAKGEQGDLNYCYIYMMK